MATTKSPTRAAPRVREATKQETRAALIQAGIALFREQGLDAPSLDAICERAGYTRGAFYVHFRDRDEFLIAVMEHVGVAFLDAVIGTGSEHDDLAATAARFVDAVGRGAYPLTREWGVRPHQLLDACARSPAIREHYVALASDTVARLTRQVRAGQTAGTLRADLDASQIATMLLAAVIGAHTMLDLGVPIDLPSAAAATLALVTR